MKKAFITLIVVLTAQTSALTQQQTVEALLTLRGTSAVEQLKQNGQYDSLMKAVRTARTEDGASPTAQEIIRESAKLVAGDGASADFFGVSVAISGDTVVVGSYTDDVGSNGDQGSTYVFARSGATWMQQAKLVASDGAADDRFGTRVAVIGDTAIIGAPQAAIGGNSRQGAAYVFTRNGTTWSQQLKLTANDGAANDQFGNSIAAGGDTLIIGANTDAIGGNSAQGSAYIFTRSGAMWSQQAKLVANDGAQGDSFGVSVAISGDTVVIGANRDDFGSNIEQGSAYVFTGSGASWSQQAKFVASNGASFLFFGESVAISGDTAVVSAHRETVGGNGDRGSAYVYTRSGTTWSLQTKLVASDGSTQDYFGWSVAISGDTIVVGALLDTIGNSFFQGSGYTFKRNGTAWTQQAHLIASDGTAQDSLGGSVAISGDTAVIGAPSDDIGSNFDQGSAYIFNTSLVSNAIVSGRIRSPSGVGVQNAVVTLTKQNGEMLQTRSNGFGYYNFYNLEPGQTVTLTVTSKRHQFTPQSITTVGGTTPLNFVGAP